MENNLTYEQALAELQAIVDELQEETTGIDELVVKTKRAAELIHFCREKLRKAETEIDQLFREE